MRRSKFAVLAVAAATLSLGSVGCEDGPNQTYSPTPAAAGNQWNNTGGSSVDPSTKDFGYLHGGTNANVLCDGPTLQKTWAKMDSQPIVPPLGGAGINMAGPDCSLLGNGTCSWAGLTIEDADKQLCQSTNLGDIFGDGELTNSWGDQQEVIAHYLLSTHKIDFMLFLPGYNGSIATKGCANTASNGHSYVFPIYTQLQKDNNNWTIDWHAPKGPNDWRNEVTSALLCSYAPTLAVDPDCNTSGRCIQGSFGDVEYLFIPVLGTGLWVPNANAPQPQPSILNRIDGYLSKVMPYAGAASFMKLDGEGPTGIPTSNGGVLNTQANQACTLKFGTTFGDFVNDCVKVHNDPTQDTAEYNKLLGGLTHNTERFSFDVQGIDINFSDDHLAPDAVITDTDLPQAADTAGDFVIDQSTLGPIVHDFTGNDPSKAKDLHGSGLVYLQYARRAQRALNTAMQASNPSFVAHDIGDPACLAVAPGSASGCTGLETILTATPAALVPVNGSGVLSGTTGITAQESQHLQSAVLGTGTDPMAATMPDAIVQLRLGLKLGHQKTVFCSDHTMTGLAGCDEASLVGDVFQTSYNRVCSVLGGGGTSCPESAVAKVPLDAQDNRFYFKEWFLALVQYMKAEGAALAQNKDPSTITIADIDAQTIDEYSLYFDSIGAGQFETAEYIERSFATDTAPPLDFVFEGDIKNGILDAYAFSRFLYRGERAMYQAMTDYRPPNAPDQPLGSQETALLTNMFGSPVLRSGWHDAIAADGTTTKSAYYCATTKDPSNCANQVPPLDANGNMLLDEAGNPLLSRYEGAFGSNATAFTLGGGQSTSQPVPISLVKGKGDNGSGTFSNIEEAMFTVPLHSNPYDMTSAPPASGAALQVLVPWLPKQPGVGFPVALDGQRDRFIETYQADFSGSQVTANIDYDFALDSTGNPTSQIMFLAVETSDFLGDVFICQDPKTKDLLRARMYTSVETLLDWIASHPNAYDDCQIIIHYSPYENYADYINSLQNGVRLSVTQGGGYGRIVDATLYDPTLPGH
jgi:hypothetical protein